MSNKKIKIQALRIIFLICLQSQWLYAIQTKISSNGEYVENAFVVDYENGKPMYFCIADHVNTEGKRSKHIGKAVINSGCNYEFHCGEHVQRENYEVILDEPNLRMIYLHKEELKSKKPQFAFDVWDNGQQLFPCAVRDYGCFHPGKLMLDVAAIYSYGGKG